MIDDKDFIDAVKDALVKLERVQHPKVIVCNPCHENYFKFHADVLGCKVVIDPCAPTNVAYLFDREEYEKLCGGESFNANSN